ncbi:MAG: hypothetical protein HY644_09035 [Acidobacteria bacterium]|nr:hypothetical protein [Acidobacteriota bacterium]
MIRNLVIATLFLVGAVTAPIAAQTGDEESPTASAEKKAPADAPAKNITFQTSVSQTSVWPGDRIHYWVTLLVPEGMKISLEDFDRRTVSFKPFTLTDSRRVTEELAGGVTRYQFDYMLANYEIGDRALEIPRLIFRYQKSVAPGAKEPSTAEMEIPPLPIAVRSTLNQPLKQLRILESLPGDFSPSQEWLVLTLSGLGGILVSLIPLLVWTWNHLPQWRRRERQLSQRKFLQQCGKALETLGKGLDKDGEEVKKRYQALEGVAQQYIRYFWNVEAAGLTGSELVYRLEKVNISAKQREYLGKLLDHGQNCRYSQADGTEWGAAFQQDLREMKNSLRTRQR